MPSAPPDITLNDGHAIPVVAFGTGTALYAKECADLVLQALTVGYTSLDAAQVYANSASIGDALKKFGAKREDVFVLTKCAWAAGGADARGQARRRRGERPARGARGRAPEAGPRLCRHV